MLTGVVTHSYQVNRVAKRYADSQPSLRGEPLHNSLRVTQNSTSSRGPVTYKNFVGQRLCGTQRPAQHNPESSWQFTALRGVTLLSQRKGAGFKMVSSGWRSKPRFGLWAVSYRWRELFPKKFTRCHKALAWLCRAWLLLFCTSQSGCRV